MNLHRKKALITGIGVVSPVGNGVKDFFKSLKSGESGIRKISRFNTEGFSSRIAGEVDIDISEFISRKEERNFDLFTQYAVAATSLAVDDAHLGKEILANNSERIGVIIASGIGGIESLEKEVKVLNERGPGRVSPFLIPKIISNMASGNVAIRYGLKGPNFSVVSACASSAHALGISLDLIRTGKADLILVGGTEAPITPISVAGFSSMRALSKRNDEPEKASRPFDGERDGFVIAEGAAVLVLESREHAISRGAKVYCELKGYGFSDDAYHMTQPDENSEGAILSMENCLRDAGLSGQDISYINAHGTSTKLNDELETEAIKKVFGKRSYDIPVSSTKSMTGHLLGAAGAMEAAATALSINKDIIFPTCNLENPDPKCDLDYVSEGMRKVKLEAAISNSFGFGGHNATLAFKKWK